MPYFVFRIPPDKQPSLVGSYDKYQEAKDVCVKLRREESPDNPNAIRMAHAKSEYEAKRLLLERRQPSSPLEEWEA
jgi:hypothetical protein